MATKKYQATPEQKKKREERVATLRKLSKTIDAMTDEERQKLIERVCSILTCDGRALSFHNTCLLIHQLPTVSYVGGFQQWRKTGRTVRKGEIGLGIWAPIITNRQEIADGAAEDPETRFLMVTVFDISQTNELPAKTEALAA